MYGFKLLYFETIMLSKNKTTIMFYIIEMGSLPEEKLDPMM